MPRKKKPRFTQEEMLKKQQESKKHAFANYKSTGIPTVKVDSYGTVCEICSKYEGEIFTLDDNLSDIFPILENFPPFCDDCSHSLLPAPFTPDAIARLRKNKQSHSYQETQKKKALQKEQNRLETIALSKAKIDRHIQEEFVDTDGTTRIRLIDNPAATEFLKKFRDSI